MQTSINVPATRHEGGALEELAHDHTSRKRFVRMVGGGGGGGAAALSLLLAACGGGGDEPEPQQGADGSKITESEGTAPGGPGQAQESSTDAEIVAYALALEQLETDFYRKVIDSDLFRGRELDMLKRFGEHEAEHVQALTSTLRKLGRQPPPEPRTKFPLDSPDSVLRLAARVENIGAAAYLGQAANIKSREILAAALSIHAVEARHAAALNALTGKSATPDGSFALPMTMNEVLAQVQPFIVT